MFSNQTNQPIVSVAIRNAQEIDEDDLAGCYYCCQTTDRQSIRNYVDGGDTAICPHCEVDALVASRHWPHKRNRDDIACWLRQCRWYAWDWTREVDLNDTESKLQVINEIIQASKPCQWEQDYHQFCNYLEWHHLRQDGIEDWHWQMLLELQDDARYNSWQMTQPGVTDGIQEDGDEFFRENMEHEMLASLPQAGPQSGETLPWQEPHGFIPDHTHYARVDIPYFDSDPCLTSDEYNEMIGYITGEANSKLNAVATMSGAHYISYNSDETDGIPFTSPGVIEIWATQSQMDTCIRQVQSHINLKMEEYLYNYWKMSILRLYKYCGKQDMSETDIDSLLSEYQGREVKLVTEIHQKYGPPSKL